jgi:hypothetical protein
MAYYQGDYYQGDFWSKLGKGVKRLGKNIGAAAKVLAPVASVIVPAVGTATLVGKGMIAARTIKRVGRAGRALTASPAPTMPPSAIASALTGQLVGTIAPEPVTITTGKVSAGSATVQRIRRAKKRRKSTARTQYRRRTVRRARRRSR